LPWKSHIHGCNREMGPWVVHRRVLTSYASVSQSLERPVSLEDHVLLDQTSQSPNTDDSFGKLSLFCRR